MLCAMEKGAIFSHDWKKRLMNARPNEQSILVEVENCFDVLGNTSAHISKDF